MNINIIRFNSQSNKLCWY